MKSPLRQVLILSVIALLSAGALQACTKKEEAATDPLTPPTLEFLGASNTAGDKFKPNDDIVIGCDNYLAVDLGPEGDRAGTILNWTLRPPNVCDAREQCGYVTVELLADDGAPIASFLQAVASPFLDLSTVEVSDVKALRATLTLGDSGIPFEAEDVPVSALWAGEITRDCDDHGGSGGADSGSGGGSSTGGANGGGGSDGTGGDPTLGGAGGLGGSGSDNE